jgi:multidrug efflux pump subunit AcrA (membrane-fusion protein)
MLARTKLRIILPFLVLLVSGAIYFSLVNSKTERQRPTLSEKIWQVEVITAQIQALSPSITLYGRIESPELLKAAAPGGGIVKDVFVRNGSRVQQGDRLVIRPTCFRSKPNVTCWSSPRPRCSGWSS